MTTVDVTKLSASEREDLLKNVLGDDFENFMKLKAKSQSKEQRKAIKARARQLCGLVKDVEGDSEFAEAYTAAKAEVDSVMDKAVARAQTLIDQEAAKAKTNSR